MSKLGISKTPIKSKSNQYKRSKEEVLANLEENIAFSFKYLKFSNKFTISECDTHYFDRLLRRLQLLGRMKMEDFLDKKKYIQILRNHRTDWDKEGVTEDGFGLSLRDDISDEPWQFSATGNNKHGRVHGFIIGNVFYIVWLDYNHNLDIGKDGKWKVDLSKRTPRAKLLEEIFTPAREEVYFSNPEEINKIIDYYVEKCDECEAYIDIGQFWYHCVFCNEKTDEDLLKVNGVHICYGCLEKIKKIDVKESEESA